MKSLQHLSLLALLFITHLAFADFPSCNVVNSDPFWADNGNTMEIQCPTACADGSYLRCVANEQQLVQCRNGDLMLLGQTQAGSVIQQIGNCPIPQPGPNPQPGPGPTPQPEPGPTPQPEPGPTPQPEPGPTPQPEPGPTPQPEPGPVPQPQPTPANCGEHSHLAKWWQDTPQTSSQQCNTCPDGSPQMCEMTVQAEYQCNDGATLATGQTRNGDVIRFENQCLPLPPRACGQQPSGTTWWTNAGTQTATCDTCWNGSQITCTYHTQIQEMCNDGVVTATGPTQRGALISQNGQCPAQPRNCGDVNDGQIKWQAQGQTQPYQCGTCIDGTPQMCVAVLEVEMKCNDGTLNSTGKTRRGAELGHVNTCPNVIQGEESYSVPVRGAKVDVLFVFDTTPLMTRTLVTMADRFKSLISSWTNIDWQVGISNAAPDFDLLHGSNGKLLEMNPGKVSAPKPLMFLTPQQQAADWIFGQNVSYKGTWPSPFFCNNPPYCEYNFPEPLRELTVAFKKRGDKANRGFFRPGATLVPVIVSAHDERFGGPFDVLSTKPRDVVAAFKRHLPDMSGMKGYSIVIPPNDTKCWWKYNNAIDMGLGGNYARSLSEFADTTGGKTISICQKDYAQALAGISQDLREKINSIELKYIPYGTSLKIQFSPAVSGMTWTTQGKKVIFNKEIPPGTTLSIRYLHAP